MALTEHVGLRFAVALGVGLLIGIERERRKGTGPYRAPAGIRTFALTALLGALSLHIGGAMVLAVGALAVVALSLITYRRSAETDPGLTTEVALLVTYLLGALAVMVMAISAAGHIAMRALGPRYGLPIAGFASGFVSSVATIAAMGARGTRTPTVIRTAAAGAILSSVATVVQMVAILAVTSRAALVEMSLPLLLAGIAAVSYGVLFAVPRGPGANAQDIKAGRAFDPRAVIVFVAMVAAVQLAAGAAMHWLGQIGPLLAAALAGFADTHSAAISIAALVSAGQVSESDSMVPILAAMSTNTISKLVVTFTAGNAAFARRVVPGLILIIAAAWSGLLLKH